MTKPKKGVIDIQITDMAAIPAKYFVHPDVRAAVAKVVLADASKRPNRAIPGVKMIRGRLAKPRSWFRRLF